jgi:hypothetical protein
VRQGMIFARGRSFFFQPALLPQFCLVRIVLCVQSVKIICDPGVQRRAVVLVLHGSGGIGVESELNWLQITQVTSHVRSPMVF